MEVCQQSQTNSCDGRATGPTIRLVIPEDSDFTGTTTSDTLTLASDITDLISIGRDGRMQPQSPDITFTPDDTSTL